MADIIFAFVVLHYNEPKEGLFIAESPKVIGRALDAGYEPVSFLMEERHIETEGREILERPECAGVPVFTAPFDVLTRLTGFKLTRGMLCAMKRRKMPGIEKFCAGARRIAILENVENPTNVGAIFRSAAACQHGNGVSGAVDVHSEGGLGGEQHGNA